MLKYFVEGPSAHSKIIWAGGMYKLIQTVHNGN